MSLHVTNMRYSPSIPVFCTESSLKQCCTEDINSKFKCIPHLPRTHRHVILQSAPSVVHKCQQDHKDTSYRFWIISLQFCTLHWHQC